MCSAEEPDDEISSDSERQVCLPWHPACSCFTFQNPDTAFFVRGGKGGERVNGRRSPTERREGARVDDSAGGSRDLWLLTVLVQLPKFGLGTQLGLEAHTCLVMAY